LLGRGKSLKKKGKKGQNESVSDFFTIKGCGDPSIIYPIDCEDDDEEEDEYEGNLTNLKNLGRHSRAA